MASFVKLFKRKTSKQGSLSDPFNSAEMPSNSSINVMHDGKQIRTASFRTNRKPNAQKYECCKETRTNGGEKQWANATEYSHHKSPYSVFTEPKMGRSARSCPVGPSSKETDYRMRNSHNFSPPFGVQPTIHERSGSYENFTASQLQQFWGAKQSERKEVGKENEREAERERNAERSEEEKPHQKRQRPQRVDGMATHGNLAKRCRCHGVHSSAHCFHQYPQQQPLSTSEYWSNDPSPIGESQSHHRHFRVSQGISNGMRGEMTMAMVGLEMAREESSSEDGDNSSDDQEISPTALLQFWQQQVRMLKRELKSSRETTEKYRNKYLRLKTKTDELSNELTREKERNIWLFNQLIATNDKMTRLNWAHIYFRGTQTQQNPLTMNATEIAENEPFGPIKDERLEDGRKLGKEKSEDNSQHRSTAGEVQAELSSDDFDDKSATMREGICRIENEHGCQIMAQQQKSQPQSMRTPTPVPSSNANDSPNGLLMGNFLCAPPFLNFNSFHNIQQIQNQLHVEVARGGQLNNARNSNSRLISPPIKKGVRKTDKSNSPLAIEKDENEEQLKHEEEEEDNDSLTGIDLEEDGPIVIPLDAFCHQQIENSSKGTLEGGKESLNGRTTRGVKSLLRNCRSSEDLRFSADNERGTMVGSAVGSSSEDDLRMWKKQLRSRGDRVLFRPSRKTLFSGVIGNEKGPNKYFRRFGQPEREALAKFDYLCGERTDAIVRRDKALIKELEASTESAEIANEFFRNVGARREAFRKKDMTGNSIRKVLIHADQLERLYSAEWPTIICQTLGHLAKIQTFTKAQPLSPRDLDELETSIDQFRTFLNDQPRMRTLLALKPKVHLLLNHFVPFARQHQFLALLDEQGDEALHSVWRRLEQLWKTMPDEEQMRQLLEHHFVSNWLLDTGKLDEMKRDREEQQEQIGGRESDEESDVEEERFDFE